MAENAAASHVTITSADAAPGRPGRPIDAAMAAYAAEERARSWRALLVGALAACSVPLWLCAVWPAWLRPGGRAAVQALWAVAAAGVLVAFARVPWARRRRSARVAALGRPARLRSEAACAAPVRAED